MKARVTRIFLGFSVVGLLGSFSYAVYLLFRSYAASMRALDELGYVRALGYESHEGAAFMFRCAFVELCFAPFRQAWLFYHGLGWVWWLVGLAFVVLALALNRVISRESELKQKPGEAHWGTVEDLRREGYLGGKSPSGPPRGYFGVHLDSRLPIQIPENIRFSHCLVVGGPGARKSTGYHKQNIIQDFRDGVNVIVFDLKYPDPRGGFFDMVTVAERYGYSIQLLLPYDEFTHRFSFLTHAKNETGAREIAGMLIPAKEQDSGEYYRNNERIMLTSLILGAARSNGSLKDIVDALREGMGGVRAFVKKVQDPDVGLMIKSVFDGTDAEKQKGIINGLLGKLEVFGDPDLLNFGKLSPHPEENVDLFRMGREKTMIYIGVPQQKLVAGGGQVFLQMMKSTIDKELGKVSRENGGVFPIPISYYLDEFTNFGPLPDIGADFATMRSRRLSYHVTVQNMAQGSAVYGIAEWEGFYRSNFQSVLIFPRFIRFGDADLFSKFSGNVTAAEESLSISRGSLLDGTRTGVNTREVSRALMSIEAMKEWPQAEGVAYLNGLSPVRVVCPRIDEVAVGKHKNPYHKDYALIPKGLNPYVWNRAYFARLADARKRVVLERSLNLVSQRLEVVREARKHEVLTRDLQERATSGRAPSLRKPVVESGGEGSSSGVTAEGDAGKVARGGLSAGWRTLMAGGVRGLFAGGADVVGDPVVGGEGVAVGGDDGGALSFPRVSGGVVASGVVPSVPVVVASSVVHGGGAVVGPSPVVAGVGPSPVVAGVIPLVSGSVGGGSESVVSPGVAVSSVVAPVVAAASVPVPPIASSAGVGSPVVANAGVGEERVEFEITFEVDVVPGVGDPRSRVRGSREERPVVQGGGVGGQQQLPVKRLNAVLIQLLERKAPVAVVTVARGKHLSELCFGFSSVFDEVVGGSFRALVDDAKFFVRRSDGFALTALGLQHVRPDALGGYWRLGLERLDPETRRVLTQGSEVAVPQAVLSKGAVRGKLREELLRLHAGGGLGRFAVVGGEPRLLVPASEFSVGVVDAFVDYWVSHGFVRRGKGGALSVSGGGILLLPGGVRAELGFLSPGFSGVDDSGVGGRNAVGGVRSVVEPVVKPVVVEPVVKPVVVESAVVPVVVEPVVAPVVAPVVVGPAVAVVGSSAGGAVVDSVASAPAVEGASGVLASGSPVVPVPASLPTPALVVAAVSADGLGAALSSQVVRSGGVQSVVGVGGGVSGGSPAGGVTRVGGSGASRSGSAVAASGRDSTRVTTPVRSGGGRGDGTVDGGSVRTPSRSRAGDAEGGVKAKESFVVSSIGSGFPLVRVPGVVAEDRLGLFGDLWVWGTVGDGLSDVLVLGGFEGGGLVRSWLLGNAGRVEWGSRERPGGALVSKDVAVPGAVVRVSWGSRMLVEAGDLKRLLVAHDASRGDLAMSRVFALFQGCFGGVAASWVLLSEDHCSRSEEVLAIAQLLQVSLGVSALDGAGGGAVRFLSVEGVVVLPVDVLVEVAGSDPVLGFAVELRERLRSVRVLSFGGRDWVQVLLVGGAS